MNKYSVANYIWKLFAKGQINEKYTSLSLNFLILLKIKPKLPCPGSTNLDQKIPHKCCFQHQVRNFAPHPCMEGYFEIWKLFELLNLKVLNNFDVIDIIQKVHQRNVFVVFNTQVIELSQQWQKQIRRNHYYAQLVMFFIICIHVHVYVYSCASVSHNTRTVSFKSNRIKVEEFKTFGRELLSHFAVRAFIFVYFFVFFFCWFCFELWRSSYWRFSWFQCYSLS